MYSVETKKTLFIPIHRIDTNHPYVWEYIRDESNWFSHYKGTCTDIDKAEEFNIHNFKTLQEFDNFIVQEDYAENYSENTLKFFREILSYILSLNLTEDFEKVMIAYDW